MATSEFTFEPSLRSDSVGVDTPLRVETSVKNVGEGSGRTWIRLAAGNTAVDREQVTLDPGESTKVVFSTDPTIEWTVPAGSSGDQVPLSLNGSQFDEVTIESAFEIESVIQDETVLVRDPVRVVVTVSHTGDSRGSLELVLRETFGGWEYDAKTVEIPANETREMTLRWTTKHVTKHRLSVNGHEIGEVTVEDSE